MAIGINQLKGKYLQKFQLLKEDLSKFTSFTTRIGF